MYASRTAGDSTFDQFHFLSQTPFNCAITIPVYYIPFDFSLQAIPYIKCFDFPEECCISL